MQDNARLWEQAVSASARGRHDVAVRLLRRVLTAPSSPTEPAPDLDLRVRSTISLALAQSELSGLDDGLQLLDSAQRDLRSDSVTARTRSVWHGQRGLLLLRAGRVDSAARDLDLAAEGLPTDDPDLVKVLTNRGVMALRRSDVAAAERDFTGALAAASAGGLPIEEAKAVGNLGYLAFLRGDLPGALRMTAQAAAVLAPQGPLLAGMAARGQADVLLAAGLLTEAEGEYRASVRALTRAGHRQDRGEAEIGLAEIARLRGQLPTARTWARRALRNFRNRGSTGWALLAELELARVEASARPALGARQAAELQTRLAAQGLREEATIARLLEMSALLRLGRVDEAIERRPRGTSSPFARLETRMLGHEVRAALAVATGEVRQAQRQRRAGLRDLQGYQSGFGSVDMLTAATRIGTTLARAGLAEALRGGQPGEVLAWSEQVRATAYRVPTVRPPRDPATAELLARLRYVRAAERAEQLETGQADPAWRAQARDLQAQVRQLSWQLPGSGTVLRPVTLGDVRAELGPEATLMSLAGAGGRVYALTVSQRRATVRALGPVAELREDVLRVRADLDLLAGHTLPAPAHATVVRSLHSGLDRLWRTFAPALEATPPGPIVLVPAGQSALVPWTLLEGLKDRAVSVVPSATWWVTARRQNGGPATGPAVFVAGPDVPRAVPEVMACADPATAEILTGDDATTTSTLAAMEGASVLHVAAHGRHEPDNPLFSSLLLSDGWLFGHDLDTVGQMPRHVVLSACETGMASIRAGDEALGMTAALLHGGCRSVVASVARVGDEVAEQVAVRHHAGLRAGAPPARALADAVAGGSLEHPVPLVCFGVGW